jgi:hypothetical protein
MPTEVIMKARLVLHHDDPPCQARLHDGHCRVCDIHPDMQSTALWYYCPTCVIPLKDLTCPACKQTFEKP